MTKRNVPVFRRRYCPSRYVDTDDKGNTIEGMWLMKLVMRGAACLIEDLGETREKFENYFMSDTGKSECPHTVVHFG